MGQPIGAPRERQGWLSGEASSSSAFIREAPERSAASSPAWIAGGGAGSLDLESSHDCGIVRRVSGASSFRESVSRGDPARQQRSPLASARRRTDRSVRRDHDHPSPRLYWFDGRLELMTTPLSSGIPKLQRYQRFAVREVWLWRKDALENWALRPDKTGYTGPSRQSRLLRGLDVNLLEPCLTPSTWRQARPAFRQALRRRSR
jgi:hypothetical protein